ncbi:MAG: phospholipase D family protein [Betaproteobacteria bacterium]|nr:phospholipase D family protein [Betaproteobacteria bacterium]MDH3437828.1 phospholipase D family protein [Betaproteobacteria bacterium]
MTKKSAGVRYLTVWRQVTVAVGLFAATAGCVTIQADFKATPSYAFDHPEQTSLGRAYFAHQALHPGKSGFRLINSGVSALMTRAALADLAEHTIDLQYYIYDPDETGAFLLERLIDAAGRGVRVRILLDDFALGFDDLDLLKIVDVHPNIEIRVFNPFPHRSRWLRPLQLALQLDTLGMRMHNKVFAVDGAVAILGGRNISNHYFEAQAQANFRDLDVLAAGPIVSQVSTQFDEYWNSLVSVPVAAFGTPPSEQASSRTLDALHRLAEAQHGPHAEYLRRKPEFLQRMLSGAPELIWASGRVVAERPVRERPERHRSARSLSEISRTLSVVRQSVKNDLAMVMAYYVPGKRGVEVLSELTDRGVRVRVLTNSLASTDVLAVYVGYSRHRVALLEAGVELYEYRADAQRPARAGHVMRPGSTDSALHAKVIVYDRRVVWIGSANSDPRSRRLNTEVGFLIESEPLAERVLKGLERDFSPVHSWRLAMDLDPGSGESQIVWMGERDGEHLRLHQEPGGRLLRQLGVLFYSLLPGLEDHL